MNRYTHIENRHYQPNKFIGSTINFAEPELENINSPVSQKFSKNLFFKYGSKYNRHFPRGFNPLFLKHKGLKPLGRKVSIIYIQVLISRIMLCLLLLFLTIGNAFAQPGEALDFDGTDDYVDLGDVVEGFSAVTFEAWVNVNNYPPAFGEICTKEFVNSFAITSGGILHFNLGDGSNWLSGVNSSASIPLNTWTHVAVTWDGNTIKMYINGSLDSEHAFSAAAVGSNNLDRLIGAKVLSGGGFTHHLNATIDGLRIWNYAKCPLEVSGHRDCFVPPGFPNLLALYHFDQGTAGANNAGVTTLTDDGPSGFTGTLMNFALSGATSNWIAPGGSGFLGCELIDLPEIKIEGNGVEITDGDNTPSAADHTDFGSVATGGGITRTFTLSDTGFGDINLNGTPLVAISGPGAAFFTVTSLPTTPIVSAGSTPFQVQFAPTASGVQTATIRIENDDCDEDPYNFDVQGTGATPLPDIPTIGGDNSVCLGTSSTLSITGCNLNCATQWQWYEGSCGGLAVGTGTSITLSPTTTTTYFARGEGGCVTTPGACASFTVTVNALPTANAISNSPICFGETINLDEIAGDAVSWQWNGPDGFSSTLKNPAIPNAPLTAQGTYNVTITDGHACTATATVSVTVNLLPFLEFDNNSPICEGDNLSFVESGGQAISWSWTGPAGFNSSSQNPVIPNATPTNSGTYFITITDVNGCTQNSSIEATVQPAPNVVLNSNSPVCVGNDLNLTETGGEAVSWSWTGPAGFSSTAQNPVIPNVTSLDAGTYFVNTTNANGCTKQAPINVIVNPIPDANATGNSPVCFGETINLDETAGDAVSWQWDGPDGFSSSLKNPAIPNAPLTAQGTYNVTITDGNSCTAIDAVSVTVNLLPILEIDNNSPICEGESLSFSETGGQAVSWSWTGPFGFNSSNQNPGIFSAIPFNSGTYSLTITGANGCTQSSTIEAVVNPAPKVVVTNNSPVCENLDLQLFESGNEAVSWSWSGPNGFSSSEQNSTISNATLANSGTYEVFVTDAIGCTNRGSADVTISAMPNIAAASNSPVAQGGNIELTESGGDGVSWLWNGPNGFVSSLQNPMLNNVTNAQAGAYSVTITDANGCTNSVVLEVVVGNLAAVVSNNGPICESENVQLFETGGTAVSWLWMGPNGFSSTEQNPVISNANPIAAGTYSVTITNSVGGTISGSTEVEIHPLPNAVVNALPPQCAGADFSLTESGGDAISWAWSGPNGFTLSSQTIPFSNANPTSSGTYSVTVTDANGCTNVSLTAVEIQPGLMVILTTNAPLCEGENLTLHEAGGDAVSWSWGGPDGFNSSEQNPVISNATISNSGIYSATITAANGCTATNSVEALVQGPPAVVATVSSAICEGGNFTLTESGGDAIGWNWSGPNGFISNDQNPTVTNVAANQSGTYFVTGINTAGCTNLAQVEVVVSGAIQVAVGNNGPLCEGENLALSESGGDAVSWLWNGPNGFVETLQNPTLSGSTLAAAGSYSVTVTNADGCAATAVSEVVVNAPPQVAATANGATCEGGNLSLSENGGEAVEWVWAGPDNFTSNLQNPSLSNIGATQAGTYSVTITDANGCTNSADVAVEIGSQPAINLELENAACTGAAISLLENGGEAVEWAWTGPNNFTSNLQNPTLNNVTTGDSGTYSVTITNATGCTNSGNLEIQIFPLPTVLASSNSPVPVGGTLQLEESGGEAVSWQWQGPNNFSSTLQNPKLDNATMDATGIYTVTITDANGCMQSTDIQVVISNLPVVVSSNSPLCEGENLQLNEVGGIAEAWQWTGPNGFSSNQQSPVLSGISTAAAGTYSVTITDAGGETFSASLEVEIHENPAPIISADPPFCESENIQLIETGGTATAWQWSGPNGFASGEQNPLIAAATTVSSGTYTVISTNANGCQSSASLEIEVTAAPIVNLVANEPCEGSALQLSENGGEAVSWMWQGPNGFTSTEQNPEIPAVTNAASGTYSLTITDANGCTNSANQSIEVDTLPELSIQNLDPQFCKDILMPVQISGNQAGGAFSLNFGQGLNDLGNGAAELLIADLPPNSYTLTYSFTDQNGCSNSEAQDFEVLDLPQIEAMSNAPLCNGEMLNLSETGGEAVAWNWNGPGGFASDEQNPILSGAGVQAGTFTIEITDANSCKNTAELEVTFSPGIAFLGKFLTPVMACVGDTVHFIEISETDVVPGAFTWTFGDGGSSTDRDPTHSYTAAGNYNVQVEVFDQACGNLSAAKTVVINQCRLTGLDGGTMFAQVFPNPSAGDFRLTIELPQRDDLLIQLFDLRGALVETRKIRQVAKLNELFFLRDSGIYFLKIKTADLQQRRVFKVVVE